MMRWMAGMALVATAWFALPQGAMAQQTLYADLGGKEGIARTVAGMLKIVLQDARIKDVFRDADLPLLERRLGEQFCVLGGGPCKYTGKDMVIIHEDLGITVAQFNALAEDLQLALEQQGVPSRVQNRLIALLAPMQREIVSK